MSYGENRPRSLSRYTKRAMVQIRLSRDLEENARAGRTPMTVDELLARFPEVPRDLRDEPILAEYVKAFGTLLRVAQKPSPCVGSRGVGDLRDRPGEA